MEGGPFVGEIVRPHDSRGDPRPDSAIRDTQEMIREIPGAGLPAEMGARILSQQSMSVQGVSIKGGLLKGSGPSGGEIRVQWRPDRSLFLDRRSTSFPGLRSPDAVYSRLQISVPRTAYCGLGHRQAGDPEGNFDHCGTPLNR